MPEATDSTRLAPRVSRAFPRSRSRFVRPTSAIEPSYDEYPRCVRLTAASTSLWLLLHRPILRLAFADESRVSRRPTRFDDFRSLPVGVVFTTWTSRMRTISDAPVASPVGSSGVPVRRSGSAKITTCSAPREKWQSVRDPRRLPSIEPTLRCTFQCLSEGHAISQVLPPGFAYRSSFRERLHGSDR